MCIDVTYKIGPHAESMSRILLTHRSTLACDMREDTVERIWPQSLIYIKDYMTI